MKHLRFLSMVLGCFAAMCVGFTSCLRDEDNSSDSMTKEEVAAAFNKVKGEHKGKLIYYSPNKMDAKDLTDTIEISWNIKTDSTMIVNNFPPAVLAYNISDDAIKNALIAEKPIELKCKIGFMKANNSSATFLINPQTPAFDVAYSGGTHKVQTPFYVNNLSSYGMLDSKNKVGMQIWQAQIYVDGKETLLTNRAYPLIFLE